MLFIILSISFFAMALVGYTVIPTMYDRVVLSSARRQQGFSNTMEQLMPRQEAKKISRLFVFAPILLGGAFFMFLPEQLQLFGALVGASIGIVIPGIYMRTLRAKSQKQFNDQLVDALMIMSSSFRGGLSLVQAFEAVVEEMPDPIRKEFSTVLGENKMGVSLEDAMQHLYNRMPSTPLQQMITSILLARETGGNLPVIFNRIVTNIRENKKIQQNIDTLTIQGKIQGVVLTILPFGFAFIVYNSNKKIFINMVNSDMGRTMLIYAVISWLIGSFMIWKISTFKDF